MACHMCDDGVIRCGGNDPCGGGEGSVLFLAADNLTGINRYKVGEVDLVGMQRWADQNGLGPEFTVHVVLNLPSDFQIPADCFGVEIRPKNPRPNP